MSFLKTFAAVIACLSIVDGAAMYVSLFRNSLLSNTGVSVLCEVSASTIRARKFGV